MIKLYKYIIYLALAVTALGMAGRDKTAISAQIPSGKPIVFGIERISKLRSQDLKPERAGPVVYNDLIFVASSRKEIVAFDFQGKRTFSTKIDFVPVSMPAVSGGWIYLGGDDGKFHCRNITTGNEIWNIDLKSLDFSQPAIALNTVIFQTGNDRVMALDSITGDWKWEYQHLRGEDLAVRGLCAPLVADNVVYIGLSEGSVAALDLETGRLIWKTRVFTGEQFMDIDAPLQIDQTSVYAVSVGGEIASLSRRTGRVFWKFAAGGMAGMRLSGDALYIGTDDAELMAIDKITGKPVWTTKLRENKKVKFYHLPTRPVVTDDCAVYVTRSGKAIAVDKTSGRQIWAHNFHTDVSAPAIPVDGVGFLVIDNKGVLRLYQTN